MPRRSIPLILAIALLASACSGDETTEEADEAANAATDEGSEPAAPTDEATDATDGRGGDDAAADGSEGDATADDGGSIYPVTIESEGGTWTLDARPERVVSLSPSATEMLFAIGAGEQVVAVDEFSTYPPEAPVTDLSGFDPNVEAVAAYGPDLVVIANDANDLVSGLTDLEIPVLVSAAPVDIESGYEAMVDLGLAVGRVDETADAVAAMRTEMDAALASAPDADLRIYHELDETFFSASSFGFIGAVYAEMGVVNIADEADG